MNGPALVALTGSCNVSRIWRPPDVCHVHTVESLWRELHLAALCLTVSAGRELITESWQPAEHQARCGESQRKV